MRLLLVAMLLASTILAQPANVKRLPPPGIAIPDNERVSLEETVELLRKKEREFQASESSKTFKSLEPDAEIYLKALAYAVKYDEFHRTNEFAVARKLGAEGVKRFEALARGEAPWTNATGLVVRGYRSRIDGSVQPYGLVVPTGYRHGEGKPHRLDIWLHGRDETLTDLKFINERGSKVGEFAPEGAFVLHPYGRYCNAFKFAGEVDVFEALDAVIKAYAIDTNRIVMRGFSMGGAGAWHLAAHHPGKWVAASPGAGFAETAEYLRVDPAKVSPWERALWQWYDATDYAANLFNFPVVAYSGELDKQRQAADVMEKAMGKEGLPLIHLIGPKTEHRYEPETKKTVAAIVDTIARVGNPEFPREVRFTTRTLRYNQADWVRILGLENHWERADAQARIAGDEIRVDLTNIASFAIDPRGANWKPARVVINGKAIPVSAPHGELVFSKKKGQWVEGALEGLRKKPGLQGPIDDAFMDSFVYVTPGGQGFFPETAKWITEEMERAKREWRGQFRGDVVTVSDTEITDEQIRNSNLILWGDPASNQILKRLASKLPIQWNAEKVEVNGRTLDSRAHVPLLIFPNPLNPEKYVVLNSGFTFRGYGSNADQTPKLPDYAVLNVTKPEPFKVGIAAAGFFDEEWRLPAK